MNAEAMEFNAETTLKRAGLQKTAQRLAVLDILARAELPLTAGDIFLRLPGAQKVNRVTVYRILSSYTRKGIIREFESKKGIHHYERAGPLAPPHPHFNCRACGTMICMTSLLSPGPWERMVNQPDWVIENISISGLCGPCRQKERPTEDETL
ncbi:MAG: transcriptional repressor [Deltaproteobacteria bacterium]|nr:transcriptional repressor [Deltaproteobacteria bacterium]